MNWLKKTDEEKRIYLLRQEWMYIKIWIEHRLKDATPLDIWLEIYITTYIFDDAVAFMLCFVQGDTHHNVIRISYLENIPPIIMKITDFLIILKNRRRIE